MMLLDFRHQIHDGTPYRYWKVQSLNDLIAAVEGYALGGVFGNWEMVACDGPIFFNTIGEVVALFTEVWII